MKKAMHFVPDSSAGLVNVAMQTQDPAKDAFIQVISSIQARRQGSILLSKMQHAHEVTPEIGEDDGSLDTHI